MIKSGKNDKNRVKSIEERKNQRKIEEKNKKNANKSGE